MEEKRKLLKLVLSKLEIDNEKLLWKLIKLFDLMMECNDRQLWRPIVDMFCNGSIEMDITLQRIQTAFSLLSIKFSV